MNRQTSGITNLDTWVALGGKATVYKRPVTDYEQSFRIVLTAGDWAGETVVQLSRKELQEVPGRLDDAVVRALDSAVDRLIRV